MTDRPLHPETLAGLSYKPSEVFDNPKNERLRSFLGRFHGIFSR